jgi:hypothetical protein
LATSRIEIHNQSECFAELAFLPTLIDKFLRFFMMHTVEAFFIFVQSHDENEK